MRELRANPFSGSWYKDTYEHVENVLYIASRFNIPDVSHDSVMLRVFPMTLTGGARRWIEILPAGAVDTWAILKKHFIKRYCPPSKISNQLMEIHNFNQDDDETLYQAWDIYNDLLYKCPTHDLNSQQKVNIFYKGINVTTRQTLDYQGPISNMTLTLAIEAIQKIADHSQKWHDGGSKRNQRGNLDGIAAITSKTENLGRDMLKLRECVHAIQVGCESCRGGHLTKNCPLIDKDIKMEEVKYGENQPFQGNNRNGNGYRGGPPHIMIVEILVKEELTWRKQLTSTS